VLAVGDAFVLALAGVAKSPTTMAKALSALTSFLVVGSRSGLGLGFEA